MAELQVGDKRNFSFTNKVYSIREVLSTPQISMTWTWDTCVCPVCKNKITNTIDHTFYRVELLGETGLDNDKLTKDNLIALGDTTDGRRMILTVDKMNEALRMSKEFKHLGA